MSSRIQCFQRQSDGKGCLIPQDSEVEVGEPANLFPRLEVGRDRRRECLEPALTGTGTGFFAGWTVQPKGPVCAHGSIFNQLHACARLDTRVSMHRPHHHQQRQQPSPP